MTEIVSIERDGAETARAELESCVAGGGVAVFPADTLYGLACDPINAPAVERIDEIKGRDPGKPSAVMYFSPPAMRELLSGLGERTRTAISSLLPGPVTLVIANPEHRYPLACGGNPDRLGVRLIAGPLAGAMTPVLQTSANRAGAAPPVSFEEVDPRILGEAHLAIDGGGLGGAPSTVVDIGGIDSGGEWTVLREGALSSAEIEAKLGV